MSTGLTLTLIMQRFSKERWAQPIHKLHRILHKILVQDRYKRPTRMQQHYAATTTYHFISRVWQIS